MISKKLWKNLGDAIAESARMTGEFNREVRGIYPHGYTIDLPVTTALYIAMNNAVAGSMGSRYSSGNERDFLVAVLTALKENEERLMQYTKLHYEFFSSIPGDYSEHFVRRVLGILAEEYGDTAVMEWWVYTDIPFHAILDDASEVVLTTAEEVAEFVLSLNKE